MPFDLLLAAAVQPGPPSLFMQFVPFILIMVVFYFLLIRPQQQARKKHEAMVQAVKRGDTVVTAGGVVGKVVRVPEGDEIIVELAKDVEVNVVKSTLTAVRSRNQPET